MMNGLLVLLVVGLASSFTPSHPSRKNHKIRAAASSTLLMEATISTGLIAAPAPPSTKTRTCIQSYTSNRQNGISSSNERKWFLRFEQMQEFMNQHGHCNPDLESEDDAVRALASWAKNQRMHYKYLMDDVNDDDGGNNEMRRSTMTPQRVHLLTSIGFVWSVKEAKWLQMYEQLNDFHTRHGHCDIPSSSSQHCSTQNKKLARWVTQQRQKYKRAIPRSSSSSSSAKCQPLSPHQMALLNEIDFTWYPRDNVWWKRFDALQEFKAKHGHCHVLQLYKPDPDLGIWCHHQRRACKEYVLSCMIERRVEGVTVSGLNDDRIAALRDIGFCWLPHGNDDDDTAVLLTLKPDDVLDSWYSVRRSALSLSLSLLPPTV